MPNSLNFSFFTLPNSKKNSILFVLISTFSVGFAWRVRGDNGFGGMSGMCVSCSFAHSIDIYGLWKSKEIGWSHCQLYHASHERNCKRLGHNKQSDYRYNGSGSEAVYVSVASGVFSMFLVGFGWVQFGRFSGFYLSNKKYNRFSFLYSLILYIIFRLLSELIFAHLIIPLIAPRCLSRFKTDLGGLSPWVEYLTHWKDEDYFVSFIGGRNYTAMVSNLSSCIGALSSFLYIRFAIKDNLHRN